MKRLRYLMAAAGALGLLVSLSGSALAYANTPSIDPSYNSRIIDDAIFLNSGSMSVSDIQNFLNSKVPTCDTNHQGGLAQYPPPYTCLKDYVDPTTGKSSAQLIYDEATSIGLNPQVILATLEKEQGLVSDTWPYPSQYKSAMGYGCPESQSVCDSSYYGFYNQVHLGARLLRAGDARDCGDTSTLPGWTVSSQWAQGNTVTIDGRATYLGTCATGALYNYTPHRPDSAYTLAADGNYYYGNYNFINFFTSWFGLTTNAYLVKGASSPTVYLVYQSTRYAVGNSDLLSLYSGTFGSVRTVADSFIASLATDPNAPALGRVIKDPTGAIYVLDSGKKFHLDSCDLVADWGGNCNVAASYNVPQEVANGFATGPDAGTLIKGSGAEVDLLDTGKRRAIADSQTLTSNGLGTQPIIQVSDSFFGNFAVGAPLVRDGVVAIDAQTGAVVVYQGGAHPVYTVANYVNWGLNNLTTYRFPDAAMSQVTLGSPITPYGQDGSGNDYLLDHGTKHSLGSSASAWPFIATNLPASYLSAVPTGATVGILIKSVSAPDVFMVESGTKRPVPTPDDLTRLGLSSTTPAVLDADNVASIPSAAAKLGTWRLFKTAASPLVDVTDGSSAWRLSSAQIANACGLDFGQILTVDSATFTTYDSSRYLPMTLTDGTNDYVCDSGYRHFVDPSLLNSYGYTTSSFSTLSPGTINYLASGSNFTHFIKGSGPTIYYVSGGTKQPFSSYSAFTTAGGTPSTTIIVNDFYLNSLTLGPSKS